MIKKLVSIDVKVCFFLIRSCQLSSMRWIEVVNFLRVRPQGELAVFRYFDRTVLIEEMLQTNDNTVDLPSSE